MNRGMPGRSLTRPSGHIRILAIGGLLLVLLTLPLSALAQDAAADELPPAGTLLEPGRYRSSAVGPEIEFRVGEGWLSSGPAQGPIFSLERLDPPGTVLSVTRFDGAAFDDSCDPGSLTNVEITVPRLVEIVAGNPFLNPAPAQVIEVDGYRGLALDVATPPFDECSLPYLLIWALSMEDGEFVQVAGQQSRFIVLDIDGDVIVIAIELFPGVPFGSLLDASMELVSSMRIVPGEYVPPSPSPAPVPNADPSPDPEPSVPPASPVPPPPDGDVSA